MAELKYVYPKSDAAVEHVSASAIATRCASEQVPDDCVMKVPIAQTHSELASTSHEPPLAVLKYTFDEAYTKQPSG